MDNAEQDEVIDPLLDTGKAARFAAQRSQEACRKLQDLTVVINRIIAMKEAEAEEKHRREGIWKRVVMMFVSLMGWDKK